MIELLRNIQSELDKLKQSLPKSPSAQVRSNDIKQRTKNLVDYYFREVRTTLIDHSFTDNEFAVIDTAMHELLGYANKSARASKYKKSIKIGKDAAGDLEKKCHINYSVQKRPHNNATTTDSAIIQTLEELLPSAAASYQQALTDLQASSRLSWRGPAADLREALRETLDHLAPDKEVEAQKSYKKEDGTSGPTMRQKVRYILSKRKIGRASSSTTEAAVDTVEELLGSFVRSIYNRSSVSAHTPTNKNEVLRVRDLVRVALCELLEIPG